MLQTLAKISIMRKIFIQELFDYLQTRQYLLLKFTENHLSEIDDYSDLDILLPDQDWQGIKKFAEAKAEVERIDCYAQSSMCQLFIYFVDGSFLQVDCLFQLLRKNITYLSNDYLFSQQINKASVKTYSPFCLFEHLVLFNQLNFSGLPKKYLNYFQNLDQTTLETLLFEFNQKYHFPISNVNQLADFNPPLRRHCLAYLKQLPPNRWIKRTLLTANYLIDSLRSLRHQRGFLISFSGVDGAGKSTILEATRLLLSQKYRKKTIVLRHRPSLLPILSSFRYGKTQAEQKAATRLPRQGKNTSAIKSLLRFAYYFLDYLLGRAYIFYKYQLRNYIVLYDRYYFDFIVDSKRTNLELNRGLPKWLYRFVQKPICNFFLYAPVEVILSRKKELTPEAITSLTAAYQHLFQDFSNQYNQDYFLIRNIDKEETLRYISQQIKRLL